MRGAREQIKEELQSSGHKILPDDKCILDLAWNYEDSVRSCIQQADLSVHLIGSSYGAIPEGMEQRSVVRVQIEVAAERSKDGSFSTLVWIPEGLVPRTPAQAQFIEELMTGSTTVVTEILRMPLQGLLESITTRLTTASAASDAWSADRIDVFISYANKDLDIASDVRGALESADIRCWIADDDILPAEIYSRAIIRAIKLSRLVLLIFTSNANDSRHVETEIDRAFNREKPIILFRTQDIPLSESLEYYLGARSWLDATQPPLRTHFPRLIDKIKMLFRHHGR